MPFVPPQFEYLYLSIKIEGRTHDMTYAYILPKIIHNLKIFWKSLFRNLLWGDLLTGTTHHEVLTYVRTFNQGYLNTIKQEGRDYCGEILDVGEDTFLKELSVQLAHYGSRGWELIQVNREDRIDDYNVLFLSGHHYTIYQANCILKRPKSEEL